MGIALAGLAVAALTGAACVLSFDDLRALAVHGGARPDLAYLYPAGFDALLVITLLGVLLLRPARVLVRLQAALALVLLILAAAAVNVATALDYPFPASPSAVGVAVAPWVMLALGLWLWLLLIKHVRAGRRSAHEDDGTEERDLVPFRRGVEADRTAEPPRPAAGPRPGEEPPPLESVAPVTPALLETPIAGPTPAPETPPVSEPLTRPEPAASSSAPERAPTPEPELERPVSSPVPEPEPARPVSSAEPEPEPQPEPEPGSGRPASPPVPEAEPQPERPVRWGDRVKPRDVLVHPRTAPDGEQSADTQPVPAVRGDEPAPRHGGEAADADEGRSGRSEREGGHDGPLDDRRPLPGEAPSGRLRSTPLPPED
ncbi:DUF2637 domain-containing protein [Nonomuraea sp. MCN248]|uniref:DUF2637 domain-containing protein n=1 Tax=Nonomuraea corallina TaxID=2989783 RepID=A0ABT4SA98_9ACTN|nr:DUF2637 domain-containing protein [Nonomuraea corallina]MDA0634082.1 DUF2637 domain-containing protein [Nonomuraea corallina]